MNIQNVSIGTKMVAIGYINVPKCLKGELIYYNWPSQKHEILPGEIWIYEGMEKHIDRETKFESIDIVLRDCMYPDLYVAVYQGLFHKTFSLLNDECTFRKNVNKQNGGNMKNEIVIDGMTYIRKDCIEPKGEVVDVYKVMPIYFGQESSRLGLELIMLKGHHYSTQRMPMTKVRPGMKLRIEIVQS